jgi:hypothetical protein
LIFFDISQSSSSSSLFCHCHFSWGYRVKRKAERLLGEMPAQQQPDLGASVGGGGAVGRCQDDGDGADCV